MKKILSSSAFTTPVSAQLQQVLTELKENTTLGFTRSPFNLQAIEQSEQLGLELSRKYKQFLVIGIGGSSMGARALVEVSGAQNIHFLDNVDALEFDRVWASLLDLKSAATPQQALAQTGFLIVSKSGSTIEILWNYSLIEQLMHERGLKFSEQTYFVSELTQSPLAVMARENKRPLLEVPLNVGGRFSVLTPVGLVVAKLCGYSLPQMMSGAKQALQDENEILSSCQLFLESFKRKEDITLFWFYNSNFRWFGAWVQQLWAESLGKQHDNQGNPAPSFSTPMTAIGACDQHSILQQVAHGVKNKLVWFYSFENIENSAYTLKTVSFASLQKATGRNYGDLIQSQAEATQRALAQNGVSTQSFKVHDANSSEMLGYLFMYFQLVVAVLGLHEGINPFDQPGVALGKELTLKNLQL